MHSTVSSSSQCISLCCRILSQLCVLGISGVSCLEQTLWRLEVNVAKATDMIPHNMSLVGSLPYSTFWPYSTPTTVAALANHCTTLAATMLHVVLGRDTVEFTHLAFPVILSVVLMQLVHSLTGKCCGASIARTIESASVLGEV
jgi:hypothetical protein